MRVCFEQRTDQMSMTPRDIAERANTREVIILQCLKNQTGLYSGIACHGLVKGAPVAAVPARVLERHGTKLADECVLSSVSDHIRQMFPQCIVLRPFLKKRHVP